MESSVSEPEEEMFEQKISQDFKAKGRSGFRHQTSGQGGGSHSKLVIIGLSLLDVGLLITAVVIGIYCAKDNYLQDPNSAATPLILEMNFLRNHTEINRVKLAAQVALVKARATQIQTKLQLKQHADLADSLQKQIETLRTERDKLLATKETMEENCGKCPKGWYFFKASCYYFSSRNESNPRKNWPDSRAHCTGLGADLLVINNRAEQQFIADSYPRQRGGSSSSFQWWRNGYWIGLTDRATHGSWVWVNNATVPETMYWAEDQPKDSGAQSGHCAAFFATINSRKTWYNGNCNEHLYRWICEKPQQQDN